MLHRGLLLDRDGVVNIDHGFVSKSADFAFVPGLLPFLRTMQDRGYRLAIVTNQSGVSRGLYTIADYEDLTLWMLKEFQREGIQIDLVLAAFECKEGVIPAMARDSYWRKPNPGMILEAAQRLQLDLRKSIMIGDKPRDMQAALTAGVGTCLLMSETEVPMVGTTSVRNFTQVLEKLNSTKSENSH